MSIIANYQFLKIDNVKMNILYCKIKYNKSINSICQMINLHGYNI